MYRIVTGRDGLSRSRREERENETGPLVPASAPARNRELALPRGGHDRPSGPSPDRTQQQTRRRTFRLYLDRPPGRGANPQGLALRIAWPRDVLGNAAQRRAAVKLAAARVAAFLRRPDPEIRAVLFYGPDAGLVRERADAVA